MDYAALTLVVAKLKVVEDGREEMRNFLPEKIGQFGGAVSLASESESEMVCKIKVKWSVK